MKKLSSQMVWRSFLVFLLTILNAIVWAQDSSGVSSKSVTKESTTTTTTDWYSQPWVWIVGGAVFIIILVALIRGSSSNKEVSRSNTTVIKDRDTI